MSDIPSDVQHALRFGMARLGRAVSPPSYIIFKIGGMTYARNGLTGRVEFGGRDAGEVIQAALDRLGDYGGTLFIKRGVYVLYRSLVPPSGVRIVGEGFGTILKHGDGTKIRAFDLTNKSDVVIENIAFDGNKDYVGDVDGNIYGVGVFINLSSYRNIIRGCLFRNYKSHAVLLLNGPRGNVVIGNVFHDNAHWDLCSSTNANGNVYIGNSLINTTGIEMYRAKDNVIAFNTLYNVRQIYDNDTEGNLYIGNIVDTTTSRGFYIVGNNTQVIGNRIRNTASYGIEVGRSRVVIKGNYIENTGHHAIVLYAASDVVIEGNVVRTSGRRALYVVGNCSRVRVGNNYFEATDVPSPVVVEAGAVDVAFLRNLGYRSEESGVAVIPAGSTRVTVSHNLALAPRKVLVTPYSNIRAWVENIGPTSFDIVTDTAPATDVNVAWYAEV